MNLWIVGGVPPGGAVDESRQRNVVILRVLVLLCLRRFVHRRPRPQRRPTVNNGRDRAAFGPNAAACQVTPNARYGPGRLAARALYITTLSTECYFRAKETNLHTF